MWLMHKCVPTTTPCSHISSLRRKIKQGRWTQDVREIWINSGENVSRAAQTRPAGLRFSEKLQNHPHWSSMDRAWACAKRATESGHRPRPAGPTCRPSSGPLSRTHGLPLLLPTLSWFCSNSFKFMLIKIKSNTWMKWLGRVGIFSQPWYAKIYFLCKYRNVFGTHV